MTEHRDLKDIRGTLAARRDVYLFPASDGALTGFQIRRTVETYVKGADTYHPFQYKGWLYYGQAFAIDRVSRKAPTDEQEEFRVGFEAVGGVHTYAKDMREVLELLGDEPPNVEEYLNRTPMRHY